MNVFIMMNLDMGYNNWIILWSNSLEHLSGIEAIE